MNKKEFKILLNKEKSLYIPDSPKELLLAYLVSDITISIWKFVKFLRISEYYYNKKDFISKIIYLIYRKKKNLLGRKIGIEIWENSFDWGLKIFHNGSIVINGNSQIGKNCKLHGDNCIGNNGIDNCAPIIGDNVDIGVGAKIIGNVEIANNIKIGAGAVVTKSFLEEGISIGGVPAKILNKRKDNYE